MKKTSKRTRQSRNHKKNLEWDFLHLRISIHRTINKATKLGTKEESKKKNVLKHFSSDVFFLTLRLVFFSGLENHYGEVPIAQEIHGRGRKLDDGVWGVESPTCLFFFLIQPQLIRCESLRKYCGRKKRRFPVIKPRKAKMREARKDNGKASSISYFRGFSIPFFQLTSRRVGILKISLLCCFHVSLRWWKSRGRGSAH